MVGVRIWSERARIHPTLHQQAELLVWRIYSGMPFATWHQISVV